jgi:hypothetical protein
MTAGPLQRAAAAEATRCALALGPQIERNASRGMVVERSRITRVEAVGSRRPNKCPGLSHRASAGHATTCGASPLLPNNRVGARRAHVPIAHIVDQTGSPSSNTYPDTHLSPCVRTRRFFREVENVGPPLAFHSRVTQVTTIFDKQALTNGRGHQSMAEWRRCRAAGPGSAVAPLRRGMDRGGPLDAGGCVRRSDKPAPTRGERSAVKSKGREA